MSDQYDALLEAASDAMRAMEAAGRALTAMLAPIITETASTSRRLVRNEIRALLAPPRPETIMRKKLRRLRRV